MIQQDQNIIKASIIINMYFDSFVLFLWQRVSTYTLNNLCLNTILSIVDSMNDWVMRTCLLLFSWEIRYFIE